MQIKWKRENIIFATLHEADVWADSIGNEIYAGLYNGYDTPDYKIAYSLAFMLGQANEFRVLTETTIAHEKRYRVWVRVLEDRLSG